jgi:intracellular multiplication protein IcmT
MHIKWWTFGIAITIMIFFALLEKYGFSLLVFGRWLRSFMAGPLKSSDPWWKK